MPSTKPHRTSRPTNRWLGAAVFLLALVLAAPSWAASPVVVVAPLEIYNAPDLDKMAPGLQAVLASRVAGQGYVVVTAADKAAGPILWTLRTTVTRLGGVYSVDAVLLPADPAADSHRTYEPADNSDALLAVLERVASSLRPHISISTGLARVAPPASSPHPPAEGLEVVAAPTSTALLPQPAAAAVAPSLEHRDLNRVFGIHRVGPALEGEARGIVAVDADGDGLTEVVVLLEKELVAFRDRGGSFERLWSTTTAGGWEAYTLSAGDVDGDGQPELFVAGIRWRSAPITQAYEWSESGLTPKGAAFAAFARCATHPDEASALLLGQPRGPGGDIFAPSAYRYLWQNNGYQKGAAYPVPEQALPLNVDWFALHPEQAAHAVITSRTEHLAIYDPAGTALFQTHDAIKGSNAYIDSDSYQAEGEIYHPNGRTLGWRDAADGAFYLVYFRNDSAFSRFRRTPSFTQGNMVAARWDGLALEPVAAGPQLTGCIADITANRAGGAAPDTIYVALTDTKGLLGKSATTRIVAYDL